MSQRDDDILSNAVYGCYPKLPPHDKRFVGQHWVSNEPTPYKPCCAICGQRQGHDVSCANRPLSERWPSRRTAERPSKQESRLIKDRKLAATAAAQSDERLRPQKGKL
jgi:hypothetical protein